MMTDHKIYVYFFFKEERKHPAKLRFWNEFRFRDPFLEDQITYRDRKVIFNELYLKKKAVCKHSALHGT